MISNENLQKNVYFINFWHERLSLFIDPHNLPGEIVIGSLVLRGKIIFT